MWTRALIRIAALITFSAFAGGARLYAQDVEPGRPNRAADSRGRLVREEMPAVKLPTESGCARKMAKAYDGVLTYLNSTSQPSSNELRKAALDASGIEPQDLNVVPLSRESTPDFLVGCSCNTDVTNTRGTFRVFKAVDRGYLVAAKSEDYSVLMTTDGNDSRIDNASLEVSPLSSPDSQATSGYFATTWTRGGGRPAAFSVIAWEWDGRTLQPIWSKLEIRNGTVDVIGPVIVLSSVEQTGSIDTEVAQPDVFRVGDGTAVYDGKLNASLLKKYADEKIIVPQSPAEYTRLAALWQSAGNVSQAITLYERAIATGNSGEVNYLYLTVADLYQGRGEFKKAAKALQNYQKVSKEQLSPQSKRELNDRIMGLQTRGEQ